MIIKCDLNNWLLNKLLVLESNLIKYFYDQT